MKNLRIYYRNNRRQIILILPLIVLLWLSGYFPAPVIAATFTVTNTTGGGTGSFAQAVADANLNPGLDTINFNIPPNDPRHFYYRNDNIAGTVSQSMIAVTTAADDSTITDIDPDWAHSWYSIQISETSGHLSTSELIINGYTQPGASANTNAVGGLNTVLRIEINGAGNLCVRSVFESIRVRGLIVNRCGTSVGGGAGVTAGASNGNIISGNFIGTDPSGTIDLGNFSGVSIGETNNSVIGGNSPADRNLVSGNRKDGIRLQGSGGRATNNNSVIGNLVGTKRDGISPLGNGFASSSDIENQAIYLISVSQPVSNNIVANNIVAFNSWNGISINGAGVGTAGVGINNRVSGNSIHSNGRLGINLGALDPVNQVTPNDPCDADTGFNNLQNYPVLTSTAVAGNNLTIRGRLDSTPGGTFTIEFYSSPRLDPTGFGEGKTYLGSTTVSNLNGGCELSFTATVPRPAASETIITSTATDANGNTSEFSASVRVNNALFDFDGDLKTDIAIFRPSTSEWWTNSNNQVSVRTFGLGSDKTTPADFTGDGKTDLAVWRPSTGEWFVLRSEDGSYFAFPFGTSGDIPCPADYDGDGRADAAVFRPSSGTWFILNSFDGSVSIIRFGTNGDIPVPADYTGDGKTDISIFRPNGTNGAEWWLRTPGLTTILRLGVSTDKPVPADYNGDGFADIGVYRPSTGEWFLMQSGNSGLVDIIRWGAGNDIPVPADYDGDGAARITVFRPNGLSGAEWWFRTVGLAAIYTFGTSTDKPIPAVYLQ